MTLRYLRALLATNVRAAMALRGAFWTQAIFMAVNNLVFFTVWFLFFHKYESVRGWRLGDVAALYGISAFGFGLCITVAEGVRNLARKIVDGDLDAYLTQPKPVVVAASMSESNPSGWGDIASGLVLLAISGYMTASNVPWLLLTPVLAAMAFCGIALLICSLAFWFGPMDTLARLIMEFTILLSVYPSSIFGGGLRIVLFTVIPAGFVSHLPVSLLRDFSWAHVAQATLGASAFLAIALWVFHRGLRRYTSGNRFGVQG